MFLTRAQYNGLVDAFPGFMRAEWVKLPKTWGVGGVVVDLRRVPEVPAQKLRNLLALLEK